MDIPESMRAELAAWNNGKGIDLESWVGCEGRFSLAVGYLSIFWPKFEEIDGYIVHSGTSPDAIHSFERQTSSTRLSVEATINHFHLDGIQYGGCPDCSADKLIVLGETLREIYEVKLKAEFPNKPCVVRFYVPDDPQALDQYEITFWQAAHEGVANIPLVKQER